MTSHFVRFFLPSSASILLGACVSSLGPEPVNSLPLPPPSAQSGTPVPQRPGNPNRTTLFGRAFGNASNVAENSNSPGGNEAYANSFSQQPPAGNFNERVAVAEFQRVDANLWRTSLSAASVFQSIAKALSQNYILSSTDRRALTLQTDWDKFFIDGRLFRNRISITVFPVGIRQTDVAIRNNVEYASAKLPGGETSASDWLPSPDVTDEVPRLILSLQRLAGAGPGSRNIAR